MPEIGPMEIVLLAIVALLAFGPRKLPELGRSLGQGLREFKDSIAGHGDDLRSALELPAEPSETPAPAAVVDHDA